MLALADSSAGSGGPGVSTLVVIVITTLSVSFFCSLCEAALYSISQARVEQLGESGLARGRRLRRLRQAIDRPIAAILTLNTIGNTVGATLAGWVAASLFESLGVGLFSACFTLGILYIAEIVPKTVGVLYADTLAPRLAFPIQVMIWVFWPLVRACEFVTGLIPRSRSRREGMSEEDLLVMARVGMRSGRLRADEARWMQNALKLDRIKVADILTPRTVVFSLPKDMPLTEAIQEVQRAPHSRIPVTEAGQPDRVVGVLLRRQVFEAVVAGRQDGTIGSLVREPIFVPEAMPVSDLLSKFLGDRQHMFIVVDEYGGTAGVVTLEDALESLLGSEIVDESDRDADLRVVARRQAERRFREVGGGGGGAEAGRE